MLRNRRLRPRAELLAVGLAVFLAAGAVGAAAAGEPQLVRTGVTEMEIRGDGWTIRYGSHTTGFQIPTQLVGGGADRTWFVHGNWLRLIDTKRGIVIGRWRFPSEIGRVVPLDQQRVQVEMTERYSRDRIFRPTTIFDPAQPAIPYWPTGNFQLHRIPLVEALQNVRYDYYKKLPDEQSRVALPESEERVYRDPLSPWLRVLLAKLLRDLGDSRAGTVFQEVLRSPDGDFAEFFPISAYLDQIGERKLAQAAYEVAYRDFLKKGHDPRLFVALIGRLVLYSPFPRGVTPENWPLDQKVPIIENIYKLTPHAEAAEMAWRTLAKELERNGRSEQAAVWRARAGRVGETSGFFIPLWVALYLDRAVLAFVSSLVAALLYLVVLNARYRPQRALDVAALRRAGRSAGFWHSTIQYWDRREGLALFSIAAVGWIALGAMGGYSSGILRASSSFLGSMTGSFAGPVTAPFFEERLPATPDRDLLLAVAYQHSGDRDKAESAYRRLPQFSESWNNLGVLLKDSGKEAEARQAFEQALRVDPDLPEAHLNLGRPPRDEWTELHHKHLPGKSMIAPPSKTNIARAFLGASSSAKFHLLALAGPLRPRASGFPEEKAFLGAAVLVSLVAILSLVSLLLIPSRDVTVPAGRFQRLWETLVPGTASAWGAAGGVAQTAWCYLVAQDILMIWQGTSSIVTYIALPNLTRSYGVAIYREQFLSMINPGWFWLWAAPALLFLGNAVLVWKSSRGAR